MLIEGAHGDKIHEEEDGLAFGVRIRSATAHISEESESVLNWPDRMSGAVVCRVNQTRNVNTTLSSAQAGCLYKPIK